MWTLRTEFGLFCVFDGHHGREAALHCREELLDIMMALLPNGPLPTGTDPFAFTSFCEEVQKALVVSFMQLQHSFAVKGKLAGSTATVVLQVCSEQVPAYSIRPNWGLESYIRMLRPLRAAFW